MKNLLTFLLLISLISNCFAQDAEKLPEIPWKAIVETYNPQRVSLWKNDVNIKLFGHYTSADSTMVENAIKKVEWIN